MPITGSALGNHPVIAAAGGTVIVKGCPSGAGRTIVIRGSDNRYYHYLHLNSWGYINVNDYVPAGTFLGFMGQTSTANCAADGSVGTHLHFEIRQGGNDRSQNAIDPYFSLRHSYAWIGRAADGFGLDSTFQSAWNNAVAPYPATVDRMYYVGWPSVTLSGDANIKATTSPFGTAGFKQFLASPFAWYSSDFRSAVIVRAGSSSTAYLVPRELFTVYGANNQESGFLGFPTSNYGSLRQNFQGGCIALGSSGWLAAAYGQYPCF